MKFVRVCGLNCSRRQYTHGITDETRAWCHNSRIIGRLRLKDGKEVVYQNERVVQLRIHHRCNIIAMSGANTRHPGT